MTHKKAIKSKIFTLFFSLIMCFAFIPSIAMASPTNTVYAADETEIDTLGVAFRKVDVGDTLDAAFDFENETNKTLKVPAGANYTATLVFVSKNGQTTTLWKKDSASFSWSRVENQLIEQKVAYCIRVRFAPKENYKLSRDADVLKRHMKVLGAELGKGKDIELWDSAGQNLITTAIEMDFLISRGMKYIGYPQYITPRINEKVSGKIATEYTDTGIWISGAPGPYTYKKKIAPIGMEIQTSNVFDESNCYYQIIAKNAMDGGTMYITATAADGQTCDIPVTIAAVSGGHEHTWVEKIEKIDFDHHGYTKCTDPDCPGVAPAFDKGSHYASHEFVGGCTASCTTCGNLGNPDAKHNFTAVASDDDANCHVFKCACGEFEKDASGNVKKEVHSGGEQTCLSGAQCDVCGKEYLAATGHKFEFRSFRNNDGTYTHLGFCKYCGIEDVTLRHSPTGGVATCQARAKCDYSHNGDVCGCEYGSFVPHTFENGVCKQCHSDKIIRKIELDIPNYSVGMTYKRFFDPKVVKGNIIGRGESWYKATRDRDLNETLCNPNDYNEKIIEHNSVMVYVFSPQTNCEFPANLDELTISLTHGELFKKEIMSSGDLRICVLLRVDSDVQSIKLDIPQPLAGCDPNDFIITEKNGLQVTLSNWKNLIDGKFYLNLQTNVDVTVKAPDGKKFPYYNTEYYLNNILEKWLCDLEISSGNLIKMVKNAESTEITMTISLNAVIECPHETVVLEAGRPATCTEDGIKDKYVCTVCGKAFFDAARTMEWYAAGEIIPKEHLVIRHDATPCSDGKDGNIVYFECQREECGKLFADAACSSEITLAQTVIHDFKTEWSSNNENHYHECKNCDAKKNIEAHVFGEWIKEVAPTVDDFGIMAHKDCMVCGKHFDKDGNEITDLRIAKIGTYNVVINGESEFYADGESVTVTAEDKEGKIFKGWQDESGKIISTDKSYTFTVTRKMTLTAVYEDVIPAKKGLSGGAIAGIVIGSVLLAGIGGFAIFWFAVKKKTFADLSVVLKKGFTAMCNGIKTACRAIGNFFKTLGAKIKSLFTKKK